MKSLLRKYFIILATVYITREFYSGIVISNGMQGIFYASFLLGFLLYILKPIISILLFPLNFLTLNLTASLTHIIIIALWAIFTPQVSIHSWQFEGGNIGPIASAPFFLGYWQSLIFVSTFIILLTRFLNWMID